MGLPGHGQDVSPSFISVLGAIILQSGHKPLEASQASGEKHASIRAAEQMW